MYIRSKRYGFRSIAVGAAVILCLLILAPAVLFAGNVPPPPDVGNVPAPPDAPITITVKIQFKGKDAVFANERRFAVTDKTIILDKGDQAITLSELPVPCEAEIKLRPSPSGPGLECLEIKVKRLYVDPRKSRMK